MAAAIHVLAAGPVDPPASSFHQCVIGPCRITLRGDVAVCSRHGLSRAVREALSALWNWGRGKDSAEFAAALKAAESALEAKRAGQS